MFESGQTSLDMWPYPSRTSGFIRAFGIGTIQERSLLSTGVYISWLYNSNYSKEYDLKTYFSDFFGSRTEEKF